MASDVELELLVVAAGPWLLAMDCLAIGRISFPNREGPILWLSELMGGRRGALIGQCRTLRLGREGPNLVVDRIVGVRRPQRHDLLALPSLLRQAGTPDWILGSTTFHERIVWLIDPSAAVATPPRHPGAMP